MLVSDLKEALRDVFAEAERRGAVAAPLPNFGEPSVRRLAKPLAATNVGLVVSLGARTPRQAPLAATNDLRFHVIDDSVASGDIVFDHPSPIRYWADIDLNVAFPRDRLRELAASGVIGRHPSAAISILGSITLWDDIATDLAPRVKAELDAEGVELALMVPFCPGCHRAMMVLARALESRGMPTLVLSTLEDISEGFKPPRTAQLNFPPGAPCGRPNDPEHQRVTLTAALTVATESSTRQHVRIPVEFQADGGNDWEQRTIQLYREGSQIVLADAVAHGKPEWIAGNEDEFTIRCDC